MAPSKAIFPSCSAAWVAPTWASARIAEATTSRGCEPTSMSGSSTSATVPSLVPPRPRAANAGV